MQFQPLQTQHNINTMKHLDIIMMQQPAFTTIQIRNTITTVKLPLIYIGM